MVALPHGSSIPFVGTAQQVPSVEIVRAQGNSSTWTGTDWNAEGTASAVSYSTTDATATMTGSFWTGQLLDPAIDPRDLYELMSATYALPGGGKGVVRGTFTIITIERVPEPSTIALLVSAAFGLLLLRRRK